MSLEPMLWALKQAPVDDPQAVLILVAMAEYAHPDGSHCYPTHAVLAECGRCSVSTVKRRLRELVASGLVRVSADQSPTEKYRADRRPVVYELDLTRVRDEEIERGVSVSGGSPVTRREVVNGGSHQTERGVRLGTNGGSLVTYKPKTEPTTEPTTLLPSLALVGATDTYSSSRLDRFEEFWQLYPKRANTSKAEAKKAWAKALKKTTPDVILSAVRAQLPWFASQQRPDGDFRPGPAPWLNKERWADEVVSPSTTTRDTLPEAWR